MERRTCTETQQRSSSRGPLQSRAVNAPPGHCGAFPRSSVCVHRLMVLKVWIYICNEVFDFLLRVSATWYLKG